MSNLEFVRYLNDFESFNTELNAKGVAIVGYQFNLKLKKELDLKILRKSLDLLQRKIPTFNLCIQKHDDKYSFYRKNITNLDFEVCRNISLVEVRNALVSTPFNAPDGPLWRSRIILPPTHNENEEFPFNYDLIFGFHHAIADGISNCKTCGEFLKILNELIEGNSVSDDQISEFSDGIWFKKSLDEAATMLENNPELLRQKEVYINYFMERNSPFEILNQLDIPDETSTTLRILNEDTTRNLLKHFKKNNVTFQSGFTACLELTLLKVFQSLNKQQQKINELSCIHTISTRRYDKPNEKKFGCQVSVITTTVEVNGNTVNYWTRAAILSQKLKVLLSTDTCQVHAAAQKLLKKNMFEADGTHVTYDYDTSNLGDINIYFPTDNKHAYFDSLFRVGNVHGFGVLMNVVMHTFKNKLHITFAHGVNNLPEDIGSKYIDQFMLDLQHLADNGNICLND